jgi:SAM-dependent methyltransferase
LGDFWTRARVSTEWTEAENKPGTRHRSYASYEEYLAHQRSSLALIDLSDYDKAFRPALRQRLEKHQLTWRGCSVLCLAARAGTEVKAFRDLGCFAVGTDINNREKNPWVLFGDFHNLEFADQSVNVVYSNSLDHVFDLDRVLSEIRRVLMPGGRFIMEVAFGAKQGSTPGPYEAFWWDSADELAAIVEQSGLSPGVKDVFQVPWHGEMRVFLRSP